MIHQFTYEVGKQLKLPEVHPDKMRHVILFNDILVFAKVVTNSTQKIISHSALSEKSKKQLIKTGSLIGGKPKPKAKDDKNAEEQEEEEYQYLFKLDVLHCQVEQEILGKGMDENSFVLIHPEGLLALTVASVAEKLEWLDMIEKAIKNRLVTEQNREYMLTK